MRDESLEHDGVWGKASGGLSFTEGAMMTEEEL